ncbi:HIT-like domain-containing protein [Radiomyces spectabilis]|uniref:HIT-like domain-containing protein n=1 Tax=Radiomyces spectabilis TaxID=64574 RepID=UPI0022211ED6|nr:HIT-like domain-containing protein [Radiomyces spectabilis]KAI8370537.1 HIT-like domain-containing protein [Radiomyces spectabilis]
MRFPKVYQFGPISIPETQVFYTSQHCLGLVNLKPIAPGHVLVISKRVATRLHDLSPEEASDMMISAQKIGHAIEKYYNGTSLTMAIQDGPQAGQSVPHVHMHLIPRRQGDWANNDDIYDELDNKKKGVDNDERKPRSTEEMKEEADRLRALFE